jgi:hypothetical protein
VSSLYSLALVVNVQFQFKEKKKFSNDFKIYLWILLQDEAFHPTSPRTIGFSEAKSLFFSSVKFSLK